MARTLSQDLRDRVIAAIDGGLSCRAAADRFVAKPRGGDRHSGRIEAHGGFIRELVAEQGDITLVEIQAWLLERGVSVGTGTLHRFFVRHPTTRKKDRARDRARPSRPEAAPAWSTPSSIWPQNAGVHRRNVDRHEHDP